MDKTTREMSKVELLDLFSLCSLPCKADLNMEILAPKARHSHYLYASVLPALGHLSVLKDAIT